MRKTFQGAADYFTVEQALKANKHNIYFEVNDGRDVTVVIEKSTGN